MNYLSAESVAKSYNDAWLFKNLSFGLLEGEKIALIGKNGTGKSTLLKILAGEVHADEGKVAINKDIKVGYLSQDPALEENKTILETVLSGGTKMAEAVLEYETSMEHPEDIDRMQKAMEKMDQYQAWDYEQKMRKILSSLGLDNLSQTTDSLSGGQKKRVALSKLLISEPQLLLLDEPTNHLDLECIEWLENYISASRISLLMVSHDRYFLDKVCNGILELSEGKIFKYKGDYAYFLEKKAEREAQEASELSKAKNFLKKELEWIRRQPKARGTKSKSRVDAFYDLKDKTNVTKDTSSLDLDIKKVRQGNKVVELHNISKSFEGKSLINDFSYIFKKQERIGIVGKNGTGKSTFLNILTGKVTPDSGVIDKGQTTAIGYFTQEGTELKEDVRVMDLVKEIADVITLSDGSKVGVSQFLQRFQFSPAKQYTFINKLSGGEKKRLQLLLTLIKSPNFIILDEPTNDLDIESLNILEEFLDEFTGSLLIVSHDRYFMDRLVDHLFVFEGEGKIMDFNGNYTDFREYLDEKEAAEKKATSKESVPVKQEKPAEKKNNKLSFQEKKEFDTLEKEIAKLEGKKSELVDKMNQSSNLKFEELQALSNDVQKLSGQIEEKTLRWLELSEKA